MLFNIKLKQINQFIKHVNEFISTEYIEHFIDFSIQENNHLILNRINKC